MWVTLTENIRALGAEGAIVDVPQGYAEHFLFPQHLAFAARAQIKPVEEKKIKKPSQEERTQEQLAADLDGVEVVLAGKTKNGVFTKPFSVKELRAALKEMGYAVPGEAIHMVPITEPGNYDVLFESSLGYEAKIQVLAEVLTV